METRACAACGKQEEKGGATRLLTCSRCKSVQYCSKQCQQTAWKAGHKKLCRSPETRRPSHPVTCSCAGCDECSHDDRMMIWRKDKNGTETFMGIAMEDGDYRKLLKLDDPNDIDGPGHRMNGVEFATECFHYYDPPPLPAPMQNPKDVNHFLVDFSDKPAFYTDSRDAEFATKFPFGSNKPQVRSGDMVKIVAYYPLPPPLRADLVGGPEDLGRIGMFGVVERFWVHVLSVTSTGIVTGISCSTLHFSAFGVHDDDWLSFSVEKILGMTKGEHWG